MGRLLLRKRGEENEGEDYKIGYAAEKSGGTTQNTQLSTYGYEDPTLPSPYDVQMVAVIPMISTAPTKQKLIWSWSGKESVTGFVIYLDGKPYKTVSGSDARAAGLHTPVCGRKYNWRVAAVAGEAHSLPSPEYVFTTAECPVYVDVGFKRMEFTCVENYCFHWTCPNCGHVDAWFDLYVNDEWAGSGSQNFKVDVTYGTIDMWQLYYWGDPKWAKVRVPLSGSNNSITVRSSFYYMNHWGEPRTFQKTSRTITMPLEKWKGYKTEFTMEQKANGVWSKLIVSMEAVEGGFTL